MQYFSKLELMPKNSAMRMISKCTQTLPPTGWRWGEVNEARSCKCRVGFLLKFFWHYLRKFKYCSTISFTGITDFWPLTLAPMASASLSSPSSVQPNCGPSTHLVSPSRGLIGQNQSHDSNQTAKDGGKCRGGQGIAGALLACR